MNFIRMRILCLIYSWSNFSILWTFRISTNIYLKLLLYNGDQLWCIFEWPNHSVDQFPKGYIEFYWNVHPLFSIFLVKFFNFMYFLNFYRILFEIAPSQWRPTMGHLWMTKNHCEKPFRKGILNFIRKCNICLVYSTWNNLILLTFWISTEFYLKLFFYNGDQL